MSDVLEWTKNWIFFVEFLWENLEWLSLIGVVPIVGEEQLVKGLSSLTILITSFFTIWFWKFGSLKITNVSFHYLVARVQYHLSGSLCRMFFFFSISLFHIEVVTKIAVRTGRWGRRTRPVRRSTETGLDPRSTEVTVPCFVLEMWTHP